MSDEEGWTHGVCPFCKRKLSVNFDSNELLHELPMCPDFKKRSADEFVQAVIDGIHKS